MRLPEFPRRRREPDLMVVLDTNTHLRNTYMDGPADICIEIVSEASIDIDHVDKFKEYQTGGVREYWIIDALRDECHFYRLNEQKLYERQETLEGIYTTPLLPRLRLQTSTLWTTQRPNTIEILDAVRAMFSNKDQQ